MKRLLKHQVVLMRIDLPIGVWMVLALAVILVVVVLIARLADASNAPPRQRALNGQHIWAGVVWLLIIMAILAFYATR